MMALGSREPRLESRGLGLPWRALEPRPYITRDDLLLLENGYRMLSVQFSSVCLILAIN